jgi:hypothetical protein
MEQMDSRKIEEDGLKTGRLSIIEVLEDQVWVRNISVKNADLVNLLKARSEEDKETLLKEIIEIGTIVYRRVQVSSEVDFVKRHFDTFAGQLETKIQNLETVFQNAVISSLSLDEDGSAAKKLLARFGELHEGVRLAIIQARRELQEDQTKLKDDIGKAFQEDGRLGQLLKQISDFERKVAERFNPNDKTSFLGHMLEELREYFDPKSGKVSTLLDSRLSFDNPESPFAQFAKGVHEDVSNLRTEIEAYRTALLGEERLQTEKEKGTQKGFEFEDELELALQELAKPFEDEVERISTEREPSRAMVGDFIYTFKDGWRVVIDAKDENMTSLQKYKGILDKAIEERNAKYGIILSRGVDQLQKQVGEWSEYEGNKLITAFPYLNIALKWIRLRQGLQAQLQEGIDIQGISMEAEKIIASLKNLTEVKKNIGAIETAKDKILEYIVKVKGSVEEGIDGILSRLRTDQGGVEGEP